MPAKKKSIRAKQRSALLRALRGEGASDVCLVVAWAASFPCAFCGARGFECSPCIARRLLQQPSKRLGEGADFQARLIEAKKKLDAAAKKRAARKAARR